MFAKRWRICRLFGIPVYLDISWLAILALLTWSLVYYFQAQLPDLPAADYWFMGLGTAIAFFVCILLHEMGHAVVAQSTGLPVNGITLFLFGGVAEMKGEPTSAGREFWMAIAGPIVSLVLAGAFWVLAWWGEQAGWQRAGILVLSYLAIINFVVILFNMVPAFPLDGGRVLRSILWAILGNVRRATYIASVCGQLFAWFLIGLGILSFLSGNPVGGIWLVLIGLFLHSAAQGGYQQIVMREVLQGEPLRRFMNTEPIVVRSDLDLEHWVDDYVYRYHRKSFPVSSNGHLEGLVSTRVLSEMPRAEWHKHTVGEVMEHDVAAITIHPDADALAALRKMQQTGSSRLLVMENDALVGIVSLKDLLRFLDLKLNLEQEE